VIEPDPKGLFERLIFEGGLMPMDFGGKMRSSDQTEWKKRNRTVKNNQGTADLASIVESQYASDIEMNTTRKNDRL